MERRSALVVAATGALLSASAVVAGAAGVLGSSGGVQDGVAAPATSLLTAERAEETTTSVQPVTVTETRDIFDTVVVPTTPPPAPSLPPAGTRAMSSSSIEVPDVEDARPIPLAAESATASPEPAPVAPPAAAPPATPPAVVPMPAGCIEPHLEDNGVWNCQQAELDDD